MWESLNNTELKELIRKKFNRRVSASREDMISMLENYKDSHYPIETSRKNLQLFVLNNLSSLLTNLPCNGFPLVGKCTEHNCTDFVHMSCFLGAKEMIEEWNKKQ